jgi:hypothetical protein
MFPQDIPGRAFLDTCVVNFMLDHGEQIHDAAPYPEDLSGRDANDIASLYSIFLTGQRASWQFAISPYTYKEVISTKDLSRRHYLEIWFFEIWHYWREIIEQNNDLPTFGEAERIKIELLASGILDVLPDIEDRILICDAIVYRCDCFCTRDWKTILKRRDALKSLPIKIITPTEWWSIIEPYAGLWA